MSHHLEILRGVLARLFSIVEGVGETDALERRLGHSSDAAGGSRPSASRTVGTMSMMCVYCVRTSPRALIPLGQQTMNGSLTSPR